MLTCYVETFLLLQYISMFYLHFFLHLGKIMKFTLSKIGKELCVPSKIKNTLNASEAGLLEGLPLLLLTIQLAHI